MREVRARRPICRTPSARRSWSVYDLVQVGEGGNHRLVDGTRAWLGRARPAHPQDEGARPGLGHPQRPRGPGSPLPDAIHRSASIETHARHVAELARRRRLQVSLQHVVYQAGNGIDPESLDQLLAAALKGGRARGQVLPSEDIADVLARPAPTTPWAARGLLAEGDVAIVSGPGGIGKTWLILSFLLSLAVGRDLFGRFQVTRPYRIALLDLESRPWELDQRLARIAAGMEMDPAQLRGNIRIIRRRPAR
jgi:hypothetical protein